MPTDTVTIGIISAIEKPKPDSSLTALITTGEGEVVHTLWAGRQEGFMGAKGRRISCIVPPIPERGEPQRIRTFPDKAATITFLRRA